MRSLLAKQVEGHAICVLGGAVAGHSQWLAAQFRVKTEDHIKAKKTARMEAMAAI